MSVEPSAFLLKEQELLKLNEEINFKTKSVLNRPKPPVQPATKVKSKDVKAKPFEPNNNNNFSRIQQTPQEPVRDAPKEMDDPSKNQVEPSPPQAKPTAIIPRNLERRNLSSEGLIKFLKSKVTILQDEVDIAQKENLKKNEELQQHQQKTLKWEQQREHMHTKNNSLQTELSRAEEKIIELELKVKERDNDTVRLGREGDVSRRDVKTMQSTIGALEKRQLHCQNEIEALKVSLAGAYERERDTREQSRLEKDCAEKQIKQLRRQRMSLITAYKQQLLVLDNLRRQNLCLEEAKMLEFSEKEFTKILNWEK